MGSALAHQLPVMISVNGVILTQYTSQYYYISSRNYSGSAYYESFKEEIFVG